MGVSVSKPDDVEWATRLRRENHRLAEENESLMIELRNRDEFRRLHWEQARARECYETMSQIRTVEDLMRGTVWFFDVYWVFRGCPMWCILEMNTRQLKIPKTLFGWECRKQTHLTATKRVVESIQMAYSVEFGLPLVATLRRSHSQPELSRWWRDAKFIQPRRRLETINRH